MGRQLARCFTARKAGNARSMLQGTIKLLLQARVSQIIVFSGIKESQNMRGNIIMKQPSKRRMMQAFGAVAATTALTVLAL
jgi:hypothetical protein